MFIEPYNNFSFTLANVPMVGIYNKRKTNELGEKLFDVKFGLDVTDEQVPESKAKFYRKAVEDFNASGRGNFHWLFSNVAVNLDIVSSVAQFDKQIRVYYPGGKWISSELATLEDAKNVYKGYAEAARAYEKKIATAFAAANAGKKAEEPAAAPVPEPPAPPPVYIESRGLSKIRKF